MLGDGLDKKVQNYVIELRRLGGKMETTVVRAATAGTVKKSPGLLAENEGYITLTKDWACYLLQKLVM